MKNSLAKVDDSWWTAACRETDEGVLTGHVDFSEWVVVTSGTKYVTLHLKVLGVTWVVKKGIGSWTSVPNFAKKLIRVETFPNSFQNAKYQEVFRTKRQAVADQLKRTKAGLKGELKDLYNEKEVDILQRWLERDTKKRVASRGFDDKPF